MDKNIIDFKTAKIKCNICPKGCLKPKVLSDECIEELGLDFESIAKKTFDSDKMAFEIYDELKTIEKIANGGNFRIGHHLKKLRNTNQEKSLNKMMEYLEERALFKGENVDEPRQLVLIDADSPKYKNVNLLIASDCAPFIYEDYQKSFFNSDWEIILFCPKNQNAEDEYIEKLAYMFENNGIKSILVMQTETECCTEASSIVKKALAKAQRIIPWQDLTISLSGKLV